jgi:hypothetical protein
MLIIRNASEVQRITHPGIRQLVSLRFQQLAPSATPAAPCEFIVVEGGEAVSEIEQAAGIPILMSLFDDLPFDHPDFYPCSDILEAHQNEHTCIYEMVFIGNDDGAATAIFVPDDDGIDAGLLALCRSFATPAMSSYD